MSWQAFYQDAVKRDGRIAFSIVFTDGTSKVLREYTVDTLSDATIQATALGEIARLSQVATGTSSVTMANGSAIDLTPPVPPTPPSDPDPARTQFLQDWRLYQSMQRAVISGVLAATDPAVVAQQALLVKNYQSAYLGAL